MSKYTDLLIGFGQGAGQGTLSKFLVLKPLPVEGVTFLGDYDVVRPTIVSVNDINGDPVNVPANYPAMDYLEVGGCPYLKVGADDVIDNAQQEIDPVSGVWVVNLKGATNGSTFNRNLFIHQGVTANRIEAGLSLSADSYVVVLASGGVNIFSGAINMGYDQTEMNELKVIYDTINGIYLRVNGIKTPLTSNAFTFTVTPYIHAFEGSFDDSQKYIGWCKDNGVYSGLSQASNEFKTIAEAFTFAKYTII